MLDAHCAFTGMDEDLDIYWGAGISSADEALISGRVADVRQQIMAARAAARSRRGWVMDTYLLQAGQQMTQVTVLILGGTTEARELAGRLATRPAPGGYLPGRTDAQAPLAGEVRTGGFGGARGLAQWLEAHHAAAVIDATHPLRRPSARTPPGPARNPGRRCSA